MKREIPIDEVKIECPYCHSKIRFKLLLDGITARCITCGMDFLHGFKIEAVTK